MTIQDIEAVKAGKVLLPNPSQQALNIIRYIGEHVEKSGEPMEVLPDEFSAYVGAPSRKSAVYLAREIYEQNLISGLFQDSKGALGFRI